MSYFLAKPKRAKAVKVEIENRTAWPTKMLRPFVTRIAREEFPGTTPRNTRHTVTLKVVYNRGKGAGYCSGYAFLRSSFAVVRVPHPKHGKPFPVLDFCHVVGHEFGHCKGITHAQMGLHYGNSCARGSYTNPHYAWATALPVPVLPVKVKPTAADKRAVKIKAAEAALVRWTRKQKLATTKLKLWTRKLRALERANVKAMEPEAAIAACGPV